MLLGLLVVVEEGDESRVLVWPAGCPYGGQTGRTRVEISEWNNNDHSWLMLWIRIGEVPELLGLSDSIGNNLSGTRI